ncbi:50S ribosomal protein L6P [Halococcus saccharolyticus DSM 5350]|uniref:50S ribosomal protein L6 n=2 Tax=Halococcus saccharolyticus TaxID=62319 RepID=M0MFJ2_9EURY|nr:50S ribosomal protein L6P [Halococcus saccharolyticus DSM 5350]
MPDDVTVEVDRFDVTVSGPEGSVTRRLWYPNVTVAVEDDVVVVESDADDAKTNATVSTFRSHIANAFHGVREGWTYEMEVFYSHFPMQVRAEDGDVVIQNFLGEKAPRRTAVHGDTTVEVDDERVTLSGPNKEDVGQTAADIEQLTRVSGKDTRVFQDGVYITEKPQKPEVTAGGN